MTRPTFSRRNFLKLAGVATLSLATARCGVNRPASTTPTASRPADVEIVLTAKLIQHELAPGKVITAWAYNGSVPGQMIRVREGQQVRVIVKNELPAPTTIHWHGIDVPSNMDGVPDISQPPIPPQGTFTYEFEARPAGTRWYHTHFDSEKQMDLGLSAPFIIEPLVADTPAERDYTLVLDDWLFNPPSSKESLPRGNGMMGGGMMGGSEGPAYDVFTINGKAFPATLPLKVKQGERVRLRLINASNMQTFTLQLAGHRLRVTHTDGNPLQSPVEVDAVPIAPAERYDVMFTADQPGKWSFAALDNEQRAGGLKTFVVYEGYESANESQALSNKTRPLLWQYGFGKGVDILPRATSRSRPYRLTLSGGMMNPDEWTINNALYPNTETLKARLNQLVSVQLFNMSMQAHPFHLHGQSFRLIGMGGNKFNAPLIKDTVDVPAMMGTADMEFVAFNPGDWMFHCHKPMHMDGGMAMLVKVV